MKNVLLLLGCVLSTECLFAQQDTTHRKPAIQINVSLPDQTEETDVLEKGMWQLESGLLYNGYKDQSSSLIYQGLLRHGITKHLELRLLVEDGKNRDTYIKETVQSLYPLAAGAKLLLLKNVKGLPDISLVTYLKLPFTSKSPDQKAYWSPLILAAFQHKFGQDKWKFQYNAGVQQEAYGRDWSAVATTGLYYDVTESFELFTEYFSQFQAGKSPQHNLGAGFTYQFAHHFSLYAAAGHSLLYQPYNYYINGGIALCFL